MRAQAGAAKREAIEGARDKVAEEEAKTEAEIRALAAEKARLQQQREREAARAHEEAEKPAAGATAATMEKAERKIQRETHPDGSRLDSLRRFFNGDPVSKMKIGLVEKDSCSSEGSGTATCPRRKGKGKTPERLRRPAERHPNGSDPFVPCSDGDGRDRRLRQQPTDCKVGVPRAGGRGGNETLPSSAGEGPPAPYRSR